MESSPNAGPLRARRSSLMKEVVELKMSVMKLASVMVHSERLGLSSPQIVLVRAAHAVTTDRLIVTDEGVRVLDTRE
jgi:hypothetical protein